MKNGHLTALFPLVGAAEAEELDGAGSDGAVSAASGSESHCG